MSPTTLYRTSNQRVLVKRVKLDSGLSNESENRGVQNYRLRIDNWNVLKTYWLTSMASA